MSDQYLEHYGVKGMEWGKKKRKPAKKQLVAPPRSDATGEV